MNVMYIVQKHNINNNATLQSYIAIFNDIIYIQMSHAFINLRPYSKSPQQIETAQKFQTQPSKSPQIQFLQYLEQKTTPFTADHTLKESNKLRIPQRQSFIKPNDQKTENEYLSQYRKSELKLSMDVEPLKKNLRSISGQWNQFSSQEDKPEPLLIKENETLRNLVTNLQQQVKSVRQKEQSQRNEITGSKIIEVDEEVELSSRVYVEQVDRLQRQVQNERDKFHQIIKDLEKHNQELLLGDGRLQKELMVLLAENDKFNEVIETQNKDQDCLIKDMDILRVRVREQSEQLQLQQTTRDETLTLVQELQKWKADHEALEQQSYVHELEQKSEDLLHQNNEITQMCHELQEEVQQNKQTQREFAGKQIQMSTLQSSVLKFQAETSQAFNNQLEQNNKMQCLQEQYQKQRIRCLESEQQRDKSRREFANLSEQNETLRRCLESMKREKDRFACENEQLIQYNEKRKNEFDLLFNDLEQVQNELYSQTNQMDQMQQDNYSLSRKQVESQHNHLENQS